MSLFDAPSREQLETAIAREFPVKAVEYLRRHSVAGPMWNDPGWGGYLLWALGPDHKVFIDGRLDFYEHAGVLSDFIHIVKLEPDVAFVQVWIDLRQVQLQGVAIDMSAAIGDLQKSDQVSFVAPVGKLFPVHSHFQMRDQPLVNGKLRVMSPHLEWDLLARPFLQPLIKRNMIEQLRIGFAYLLSVGR